MKSKILLIVHETLQDKDYLRNSRRMRWEQAIAEMQRGEIQFGSPPLFFSVRPAFF
jgi:hypothetical protein